MVVILKLVFPNWVFFCFFFHLPFVSQVKVGRKKEVFLSRAHDVPVHAVLSCLAQAGGVFALDLALT